MSDLTTALRSGRLMFMDGAMGTELQRAGMEPGACFEAWNLARPEIVRGIHRAYVAAGAEVLVANTFQANPTALARHHEDHNLATIVRAGLELARTEAPAHGWVLADVGPMSTTELKAAWAILNACGPADGILLETFSDPADAAVFLRANRSRLGPNKPMLVSFTFDGETLRTCQDLPPEKCARAAETAGAAAVGVNCGRELDMDGVIDIVRRYRAVTSLPLFARPNAGTPIQQEGGWHYPRGPREMAERLPELIAAGLTMIGGCCGTTPAHIQAFRERHTRVVC